VLTATKGGTLGHSLACVSSRVFTFAYRLISAACTIIMVCMHVLVNSRFTENTLTLSWLAPSFHDGRVTVSGHPRCVRQCIRVEDGTRAR
jgi:hypothetical protein